MIKKPDHHSHIYTLVQVLLVAVLLRSFCLANNTQAKLDFSMDSFGNMNCEHNQVSFQLHERFSLIVKRYNNEVYVLLRSGKKDIKVPCTIFNAICNLQVSISY